MRNILLRICALALVGVAISPAVRAASIPLGIISYDVTGLNVAQFDIINFTGPASSVFPDTTFPITTPVTFSSLSLTVMFASGPNEVFGPSYFTADGLDFDGTAKSTLSGPLTGFAGAIGATLAGTLSTTSLTLNDGSTVTVDSTFSASVSDAAGLMDGDFGEIDTDSGGVGPPPPPSIPEPGTWYMVGTGMAALATMRRKLTAARASVSSRSWPTRTGVALGLCCLAVLIPLQANAQTAPVNLNAWTAPGSGASGSTFVSVNGDGFPAGSILPGAVTLTLSTTCGGSGTVAPVTSVTHLIGSADRLRFEIPAFLDTGLYFVSVSGTTSLGNAFASSDCSEVQVSHTSTTLAACLPSSSLAVLSGTTVTAYVPNGWWGGSLTGVQVVPIEGGGAATSIATPHVVNSCSSNSATGQTVCVANNTDVYEITGTALNTTLASGSTGTASFSGGSCNNCGIAINALTNTAVIAMGVAGSPSRDGVQLLNLADNTFVTPFPTVEVVSENQSIDPNRNLILSPGEANNYDLLRINADGSLTEYTNQITAASGEFDSAAEDCTTGIALSTQEFTSDLFIEDLTQAVFTAPSGGHPNGTYTAPGQVVNFPEFGGFGAGTSGISVAAGTTHLGIVAGEFGSAGIGVFQLPATSGTGTPAFVDYAAAVMPNTPSGAFSLGFDPHTITAYTSPNDGRAYGLVADWASGSPSFVGVVDLQKLLSAPRNAGTHTVMSSYNLIANGVVRYVATH